MRRISGYVILLLVTVAAEADAFRCDGGLVREGDRRFEVLLDCDEPDFIWSITDLYFPRYAPFEEIWIYNLDPHRLIRVLHFRDGRLQRIETAGYGFREADFPDRPCRPSEIRTGMTVYELLLRCGEPIERVYRPFYYVPDPRYSYQYAFRAVEDWYYAGDPRYQPRRVRVRDAIVIDVSTRLD
jgi:hypothetical protein